VLADALAATWHAWIGLVKRGKDPVVVGLAGITYDASRYVKSGRRLGCGPCGRGRVDILDRQTQYRLGLCVLSIDAERKCDPDQSLSLWREQLIEDRRVGPADMAISRLDFGSWLRQLPARKRDVAQLLALGEQTGTVARLLGLTPGAVSQTRTWLHENWRSFQSEPMSGGPQAVDPD
jgi:hypothetical protein